MVDMARDMKEEMQAIPAEAIYPYSLCIALTNEELEKLDLDDDCEVGDLLHMICMAKVTSVNKNEGGCRIEMQIFDIETLEDENTEYKPRVARNPYE